MADSKPVQSEEVIVKGVFDPAIKNAQELESELNKLVEGFNLVLKEQEKILKQSKKGLNN